MTQPESNRLRWLFMAALATITVMMAPPASARADPVQAPAARRGIPPPAVPAAPPDAAAGNGATRTPGAGLADTTVPPPYLETLDTCMGYWDAATHMSKSEWREACRRTLNGTELGDVDLSAPQYAAPRRRGRRRGMPAGGL
jgi:hypothetical protein